ncbi:unnamed protein product, partial [Pelagomonas calceolata]
RLPRSVITRQIIPVALIIDCGCSKYCVPVAFRLLQILHFHYWQQSTTLTHLPAGERGR